MYYDNVSKKNQVFKWIVIIITYYGILRNNRKLNIRLMDIVLKKEKKIRIPLINGLL